MTETSLTHPGGDAVQRAPSLGVGSDSGLLAEMDAPGDGNREKSEVRVPLALAPALPLPDYSSHWQGLLDSLFRLAQKPNPGPAWWNTGMPFRASLQTWTARGVQYLAGTSALPEVHGPSTSVQLTMAGWGHYGGEEGKLHTSGPGRVLFGSRRMLTTGLSLPEGAPEWTFASIEIHHPYFLQRIAEQARGLGQVLDIRPDDALTANLLRLVRAEISKGLHEPAYAERMLFDFVLSLEHLARRRSDSNRETGRLIADARACILAKLPQAVSVENLAARFGMSRCHFSHYFRKTTGMTPARFATEVRIQKAEEMLLESRDPLKGIADACGFANSNHLCKVFRRLRQVTPTVFRQKRR